MIDRSVLIMGMTRAGRYALNRITANVMGQRRVVRHGDTTLTFSVPNALARYRADSLSIKEPETLRWIDGMPRGAVVWDVGANVGLYSCYAAKHRGCRVFAFEPSVFNLELLARNIFLNGLVEQVTIVPLPLTERRSFSRLNMTSTDWGGAMSTFGQDYGHDGRLMSKTFEFSTIGLSMDDAANLLDIPRPDYLKMDVDGIEHLILKGGPSVLNGVKGVLIEINDEFAAQAGEAKACLERAGFLLKEKTHADIALTGGAASTFNQIWIR